MKHDSFSLSLPAAFARFTQQPPVLLLYYQRPESLCLCFVIIVISLRTGFAFKSLFLHFQTLSLGLSLGARRESDTRPSVRWASA